METLRKGIANSLVARTGKAGANKIVLDQTAPAIICLLSLANELFISKMCKLLPSIGRLVLKFST